MEMFEYAFMQRAFIVGVLLALIIPLIGVTVVLRRLSMLGDALSHTSLAGVAAGLLLNVNPVFGASVFCVGAAFGIEGIRRRFPRYELSISVMLSAGVGLAGVLSGFTKNAANFNSFLFGSIVAISDAELYSVAAVSLLVLLASVLLYKELFSIALDERAARLSGVPVNVVSTIFTMLTAVTVAIAAHRIEHDGPSRCVRDAACEELPRHSLGIHRLCRAVHHFRTRHCILWRTEARRNHCADGCCVSDRHTDREIRCGAETGKKGLIFAVGGDERPSFFTLSRG